MLRDELAHLVGFRAITGAKALLGGSIGAQDTADVRQRSIDLGRQHASAADLFAAIAPVLATRTYAEWERILSAAGITFGVIGRVADVVDDEQARHAGIIADTANPEIPRTVNNPIRLGFARPRTAGPPPAIGQHNDEVLRELAYSEVEIAQLRKAGAFG